MKSTIYQHHLRASASTAFRTVTYCTEKGRPRMTRSCTMVAGVRSTNAGAAIRSRSALGSFIAQDSRNARRWC